MSQGRTLRSIFLDRLPDGPHPRYSVPPFEDEKGSPSLVPRQSGCVIRIATCLGQGHGGERNRAIACGENRTINNIFQTARLGCLQKWVWSGLCFDLSKVNR